MEVEVEVKADVSSGADLIMRSIFWSILDLEGIQASANYIKLFVQPITNIHQVGTSTRRLGVA